VAIDYVMIIVKTIHNKMTDPILVFVIAAYSKPIQPLNIKPVGETGSSSKMECDNSTSRYLHL